MVSFIFCWKVAETEGSNALITYTICLKLFTIGKCTEILKNFALTFT